MLSNGGEGGHSDGGTHVWVAILNIIVGDVGESRTWYLNIARLGQHACVCGLTVQTMKSVARELIPFMVLWVGEG